MHEFCPIHDDAAPFFMEQFNLDPEEYTTLMGKFGGRGYTHPPYLLKKAADKLRLVIKFLWLYSVIVKIHSNENVHM